MNKSVNIDELFQKRAPGVYRTEKFETRPPQFLTGVPVFIGVIQHAKQVFEPQGLHFWPQFEQHFGKPDQDCLLAYAVRGFFENCEVIEDGERSRKSGKQCYVVALSEITQKSLEAALKLSSHLDVDLVCAPDLGGVDASAPNANHAVALQQVVVRHCGDMGNRFAILDSHSGSDNSKTWQQWSDIDGIDGAVYYPWVWVHGFRGGKVLAAPCGHVAGVYARTDLNRGVHKAPANEVLEGVVDLERHLSDWDQDHDNRDRVPLRVNCLRSFPGRGIRVWGARTLSGHNSWTFVNVRRLFLTAVRWIERNMEDVVFEPNDARLWARIERELSGYFLELYGRGALKGRTAQEAFFVKCNRETNPKEVVDLGQVVAEIGLATATPFEFVVVRLICGRSGVKISGPHRPESNTKN